MKSNITLIPTIHYTVGPNYTSEKIKGSGYYKAVNPLHTVAYSLMAGFVGSIIMQGTLATNPTEDDWADLFETEVNIVELLANQTISSSFKGQFVWVRAVVTDFTAGSIEKVSYSYN